MQKTRTIRVILATLGMVIAMLLGVAGPSRAGDDKCEAAVNAHHTVPASCITINKPSFDYVKSHVGANPYSFAKLLKRYGKSKTDYRIASDVQFSTFSITHQVKDGTKVPKLKKPIPWPSYKAKSAKKYKKTKYSVYEIYGEKKNGTVLTWKYGITRQADENTRPKSQYSKCNKYFKKHKIAAKCSHTIVVRVVGWFAARSEEASLTTLYAATHKGHCPPGMPKCV